MGNGTKESILRMEHIYKEFPGVKALNDVTFDLRPGEVHALLGENGAGKSTLIKIITGAYECDRGDYIYQGQKIKIKNAIQVQEMGVRAVYQEFNLVPQLNAYENIFLMKQLKKGKFIKTLDRRSMKTRSEELIHQMGINFDVEAPVSTLSVAYQQMIEITKALAWDAKVMIFDEPTAVLTEDETEQLFKVIKTLREKGVGIIYISHRLEEIFEIADRVTILRDGIHVDTFDLNDEITKDVLITKMVGRTISEQFPKVKCELGEEILRVENLTKENLFHDISFNLRKGEILGITGLVGAGRTELVKTIFGAYLKTSGKVFIEGKEVNIKYPADGIKNGIALAPEDRKREGLVQIMSIADNIVLANQKLFCKNGIFSTSLIKSGCENMVESLNIKTDTLDRQVKYLSGGNQQKVVLAKWLVGHSKVVIFDEPTRGIDVGAKVEVYNFLNRLVSEGIGVIIISSEMPEVLGMSDRILVMHEGHMTGILSREEATQEKILKLATL